MSVLLPTSRMIEASALTREAKAMVPTLAGVSVWPGAVEFRRLTGEFDTAEQAALQAVLVVHDAAAIEQAKMLKAAAREAEKAKDPKTLSVQDRLTRLEVVLGLT